MSLASPVLNFKAIEFGAFFAYFHLFLDLKVIQLFKKHAKTSTFSFRQKRLSEGFKIRFQNQVLYPYSDATQEPLIVVKPLRPPMTNVGTETAFMIRHNHCQHFQKSNISRGQRSVGAINLA